MSRKFVIITVYHSHKPSDLISMESILATWTENQMKTNSSVYLMAIKAKALDLFGDLQKDFSHYASLEFTKYTGRVNRYKNWQQLKNTKLIKFTG
jgi:hypothetical protein